MLTDKEIEEFANEFREWKKKPRTWVSDGTCPNALDLKYSQFMYPAPLMYSHSMPAASDVKGAVDNDGLKKIIDRMESISKGLIESGVMNYGLSLKSNIEELKKLIAGAKE